jgi:predicted DNA-binding mobile mystery protein A
MEKREKEGKVTLETLNRAAEAMGCKLVYAIVPDESLEQIVDEKSREAARELLHSVSHTMKLEEQGVSTKATQLQLDELTQKLKARLDSSLWEKRT